MHGFFAAIVCAAALLGCGGREHTDEAGAASSTQPGIPKSCDDLAAAAKQARAGTEPEEKAATILAQADCEQARLGPVKLTAAGKSDYDARVASTAALYDEVIALGLDKWTIGGQVREGELYGVAETAAKKAAMPAAAADWRAKRRPLYEAGLGAADKASKDVRFDVEVSDWIKSGCAGLRNLQLDDKRFKVCNPWKESWR
jgi:hypothetical protein